VCGAGGEGGAVEIGVHVVFFETPFAAGHGGEAVGFAVGGMFYIAMVGWLGGWTV
jgi:hypothetical protein